MKPTLLVLAAGIGSRYGGIKQMEAVGEHGEVLLDYSIYDAIRNGFQQLVFVIREEIEDDFRRIIGARYENRLSVRYVYQTLDDVPEGFSLPSDRKKPWGTAHAVRSARNVISENFAVINSDDFYGYDAYHKAGSFLNEVSPDTARYALIGYVLENTLSPHGTVARGICSTREGGLLDEVVEHTGIRMNETGIQGVSIDGEERSLSGDEIVSMNLFCFTPTIFSHLNREFENFLKEHGDDPKAEFYIPTAVTTLIRNNEAEALVIPTSSNWFGMTYREDKARVVENIKTLSESGKYPSPLWPE